ncbi:MAG: ATP-dependent DNA helicase PcrA [Caldiserica bacterium CG02_land_8_20_14_3_00_36_38]|nr:MAG: ATP-dependent DNA helicase PcrA [Caldiserica bacterium CG02_land_8_20_14_3_00_36_38]PIW11003.1 MAG: ATP-dependent DNA helicase PcrA [Caldiserica bacterium CG17_big_fil_post_rev_8_21_14_2_50_35_7]
MRDYLEELNEAQREAVIYNGSSLLIFAGAGSGKTRVITYKIAYLIDALKVSPSRILAVTFTNKAANEMKGRTESLLGDEIKSLWIGTFHSICAKMLRRDINLLGFKSNFTILDEDDSERAIKEVMKRLNIDTKYLAPSSVKNYISQAKTSFINAEDFKLQAREYIEKVVSSVYSGYEAFLKLNNSLDFDDLIFLTVKLLKEHEDVAYYYSNKFKYLLVDEYQDINMMQYQLIKLLSKIHRRLTVVGDDDQSIYSFRGASVEFIDLIQEDFKDLRILKLEQNYRSPQEILNTANRLIKHNRSRSNKQLFCDRTIPESVNFYEALDEVDEARFVVKKIENLAQNDRKRYNDFAILYRTNAQSRIFEEYLINKVIPYQVIGGVRFYSRAEIKDIIAYLSIINNPYDDISFRRIINIPSRKIGEVTISKIEDISREKVISLFESLAFLIDETVSESTKKNLKNFYDIINDLIKESKGRSLMWLVEEIVSRINFYSYLLEKDKIEGESRVDNVKEFISMVSEFSKESEKPTLAGLLTQISLVTDIDEAKGGNRISLMTLHSAKGLEFPVVFLVGLEEGFLPHYRSLESEKDIEEERRLCYVGITRAKESLFFSYALRRNKFGYFGPTKPSRFLEEIRISEFVKAERNTSSFSLNPGDHVLHKIWGIGKVIEVHLDSEIPYAVINFLKIGTKKLDLRYAPLERAD